MHDNTTLDHDGNRTLEVDGTTLIRYDGLGFDKTFGVVSSCSTGYDVLLQDSGSGEGRMKCVSVWCRTIYSECVRVKRSRPVRRDHGNETGTGTCE